MSNLKFLLLFMIVFVGCSKSGDNPKIESPIIQEAYLSATVGQEEEILLDLGSIPYGKYKDGLISIKQNQISTLIPSGLVDGKIVLEDGSSLNLSILSQSGCTSIKKSTDTCNIKIRANANGLLEGGLLQGSILFHTELSSDVPPAPPLETRIYITAVVGDAPVIETPTALVSSTSSSIDFGSLSISDQPKDLIVTYRAISLLQSSDSHQVAVSSPFVIQSSSADRCSNKTISKGSSCTVKVRLDPSLVTTNGLVSGNISFAGLSIPLSATIAGNPDVGQPAQSQLAWIYNGSEISSLDLGTILSSNVPVKFNLYLKNKGNTNEEVNVTLSGSGFNIINRCQNKELLPQGQCSLEVRPENTEGSKSVSIAVDDQPSLSLPMEMNVINQVITYATVDTTASCSSLNLQVCGGTQNISKTYLCEQYVDGVKNESYSGNDCQPLADMSDLVCLSPSGNYLEEILGGDLSYNCGEGISSNDITPTVLCDQGYSPDQLNLACIEDVVIPNRPLGKSYGFNANVLAIEIQEDGKMIVGGNFSTYNGTSSNRIVRLNSDGSLDTSFNVGSGFNDTVQAIEIQEDGKIVVGGAFNNYNATTINRIARLNVDGTLDTSFTAGFNSTVNAIEIQEDGKLVVGGAFNNYNATTINRIARLNVDGTLDTSFNVGSGFNNQVNSIAIQEDGKIVVGGAFATYNGMATGRIARLNVDGTLDASFNVGSGFLGAVNAVAIQEDGKIVVGGVFTTYNATSSNRIARLNVDGTLDTSFNIGSGFGNIVSAIAIQEDGKIVVGGSFADYNTTTINRIARLNVDGTLDTSFNVGAGFNSTVTAIAIQEDEKIFIGGAFSTYNGKAANRIVRLNLDGTLDTSFTVGAGFSSTVNTISIQEDGKIVIGGAFATYNGTSSNYIARFNVNGILDTSFTVGTGFLGAVNAVAIQEDGKIVVGGLFTIYNGTSISRIARLNVDGTLDTSFTAGFGSTVNAIAIQEDGKLVVGGAFATYNATSVNRIVRLNVDGTLDTSFTVGAGFDSAVSAIAIQEDGKLVVVGAFTNYNGTAANRIVRLNVDGTLDTSFTVGAGFNSTVTAIEIQEDGKIFIGGGFTTYNATSANRIVRLNVDGTLDTSFNVGTGFNSTVSSIAIQEDGKLVVGGSFATYNETSSNRIARLNVDGTLDTSFTVGTGFNSTVNVIAIQEDGKLVVGGFFSAYDGILYDRIIRLNNDGTPN